MLGLHHGQMGVAAEIIPGVGACRADDRDGLFPAGKRQRAVVFEQYQCFPGGLRGELFVLLMMHGLFQFVPFQGEGMLKQAHAEFGLQDPANHAVQQGHVRFAAGKLLFQFRRVGHGHGQLNVQPRFQAAQARIAHGFAHALVLVGVAGPAVVGHGDALKAHFTPQNIGQIMLGGVHGQAVDGAIAGHDAFQARFGDRGLEGLAVDLQQQPVPRVHVGPVDGPGGIVEAEEVLGGSVRPAACGLLLLNALCIGAAHGRGQGGVFAVRLALASHTAIPGNIQYRR